MVIYLPGAVLKVVIKSQNELLWIKRYLLGHLTKMGRSWRVQLLYFGSSVGKKVMVVCRLGLSLETGSRTPHQ